MEHMVIGLDGALKFVFKNGMVVSAIWNQGSHSRSAPSNFISKKIKGYKQNKIMANVVGGVMNGEIATNDTKATDCEVAIITPYGEWVTNQAPHCSGEDVQGFVSLNQFLDILLWARDLWWTEICMLGRSD